MRGSSTRRSFASILVLAMLAGGCTGDQAPLTFESDRCTPDVSWPAAHETFMQEVVRLVNEHRATLDLSPLTRSVALERAAVWKARHLAQYRYFSHADPAPPYERTTQERFADCGYPSGAWENIAGGDTPQQAMSLWLKSPGHKANIENPNIIVIGVGVAAHIAPDDPYPDGRYYGKYAWVQAFGDEPDPAGTPSASPTAAEGSDIDVLEDPAPGETDEPSEPDEFDESDESDDFDEPGDEDPNEPPIARPDRGRVRWGRMATFQVLANDSDPDGDALEVVEISAARWGRVRIDDRGNVIYKAGRRGPRRRDTIRYTISDGRGGTAEGVLTVVIR